MRRLTFCIAIIGAIILVVPAAHAAKWRVPEDFATIQAAIDSVHVADGDRIMVAPGSHAGADVTKGVQIKGEDGAVIDSGPMHPAGLSMGFALQAGSDGATISHLTFTVDLAVMNRGAVDDVTVEQCTFLNTIQAVSNWSGSGWDISHNVITDLRTRSGGGIGILIADSSGGGVEDNVVSHNTITGTLHVSEGDCGGYDGSGIVIYADFRWGRSGAEAITNNRVVQNTVGMVSDTPSVVDINAFELTDTRGDPGAEDFPVIFDNAVGFNDFRDTAKQILITPPELDGCNDISRNLGDNRGQGQHPSIFGPGGD